MAKINCPKCGEEIEDTEVKCPICNEVIKPPVKRRGRPRKDSLICCEECGKEFDATLKECPNCGCPVEETNPIKKETIKCIECNKQIPKDTEYCPFCGYPISEEKPPVKEVRIVNTKVEEKKPKKRKNPEKTRLTFFYIFIAIFFIAGCITAAFIYDKTMLKNTKDKEKPKETFNISKTLSCINDSNTEERNYYFDQNELVQYSMYSNKEYYTDSKADSELKSFKNKWENDSSSVKIYGNKTGTKVEKSLIIDVKNSSNIKLDDIKTNDSLDDVKQKIENKNFKCTEYNEDLGTNLPLNNYGG